MRVFLIDFENMRSEGLRGIDNLSAEDTVVIFYSNNADTLSFAAHAMIMSSKANIVYYKIKRGGKNALDFQLITCLGYMLAKEPEAEYFVISKDTGYDFAIEFWADNFVGVNAANISRCYTIRYAINRSLSRKNGTSIEPEEEPVVPETESSPSDSEEENLSASEETEQYDEASLPEEPSISEEELEAYENGALEEASSAMNLESVSCTPDETSASVSEEISEAASASEKKEQTAPETDIISEEAKPVKKASRRRPARKTRSRKSADEKNAGQGMEPVEEKADSTVGTPGNTAEAPGNSAENSAEASVSEEAAPDDSNTAKKPSRRRPARRRPSAKKKAPASEE